VFNGDWNHIMTPPFFATHADRVSLARERYFEEGILPTGVVNDAVFQSWSRCYRSHHRPVDKIEFQPVSPSRSQLALQKNHVLHEAWVKELPTLGTALGSTGWSVILTDATGVLIGTSPPGHHGQSIIPIAHRVGINLSEEYVGTTAPGIVVRTGKQASVLGSEHFYESVNAMYCTAAPIRNIQGRLAGILDISCEGAPFQFDPSAVVGLYAASIENRLLIAQSTEHLIVRFQVMPAIIDTPMVGILGFDLGGKLVWTNSIASTLLGIQISEQDQSLRCVGDIFEGSFAQLASLAGQGLTQQYLRSGLPVFLTCELRDQKSPAKQLFAPAASSFEQAKKFEVLPASTMQSSVAMEQETAPPVDSLKQADADLIQKYLAEFNGNVSQVAKRLKVSRGLIYRRLQDLAIDPALFKTKL
jgi:sigma-54 dependent transcriptional regulator, acetoin dehydrogenase operon transcriptional activator AcoR